MSETPTTDLDADLVARFEQGLIDAPSFRHRDHLHVAFAMLERYEFVDACARYAVTIREMAESVGALDKYNATVTLAFLSLIAERKSQSSVVGFEDFLAANADLLDRDVLGGWYSNARLSSVAAHKHFLLPDRVAGVGA